MGAKGYTLTEVLITVLILAVLASLAVPNFTKSMELGYRREATDMLSTVYTGERTRFFESGSYYFGAAAPLDGGDPNSEWRQIFTDNPNTGSTPVAFTVTGTATTFTVTATRDGSHSMTVNEQRQWCGDTSASSSPDSCFDAEWVVN